MLFIFLQNRLVGGLLLYSFFTTNIFASFTSIYDLSHSKFTYAIEDGDYKVYLSQSGTIDYKSQEGFKFFLPKYTKSFHLNILRFNSIGSVSGYLSLYPELYPAKIIKNSTHNLNYYLSDYHSSSKRQLTYLLKGSVIPYKKKTSIAIEGIHIPAWFSVRFNRWFYFLFDKKNDKDNKLRKLIYSYSMILDKKNVDAYVKKYLNLEKYPQNENFNALHTYIRNLNSSKQIHKKKNKVKTKPLQTLELKKFLTMKEFGYNYDTVKCPCKEYQIVHSDLTQIVKRISSLESYNGITDYVLYNKKIKKELLNIKQAVINLTTGITDEAITKEYKQNKCDPTRKLYNKNCLKNIQYIENYIYYAIKKDILPEEELILGYGDGRVFNDVAKYYFEKGILQKAERYLLKAYVLLPDEEIVSYNLGVYYATLNTQQSNKKAIKYFEKATFPEAYFNLGVNYYIGLGVKENNKRALKYFQEAANKGLERAKQNQDKLLKILH